MNQKTYEQAELATGNAECAQCGAVAEGAAPIWTCTIADGVRHHLCDTCTRAHLRVIESHLDPIAAR
ncbi:hypothetical protein ACH4FX_17305 [Streptomyces sp. NPDC018019]|uniref:hypothetical protein n=1 Tax=Streptomyces sp. NPDC018019 TaxID=3365030 RepID=UPI0037A1E3D3